MPATPATFEPITPLLDMTILSASPYRHTRLGNAFTGVFCSGPRKWLRVLTTSWNALGAVSGIATICAACSRPSPRASQPSATSPCTCKRSARFALLRDARSTMCAIALRSETPSRSFSASLNSSGESSGLGCAVGCGSSHDAAGSQAGGGTGGKNAGGGHSSAAGSPRIASSGNVSTAPLPELVAAVRSGAAAEPPCTTRL